MKTQMKNPIFPLLIIGLLFFASFGLVIMSHIDGQGHSQCPFEMAGVTDCVQVQNPMGFAISHLNALSKFFSAIPVNSFTNLIVIYLLLAFTTFFSFKKDFESFKLKPIFIRSRLYESFVSPNKILLTRWFSLHENSPALTERR